MLVGFAMRVFSSINNNFLVIAVHRNGKRIQDYPGNIKLNSGDVLLLEAGPTFIARNTDNQRSFALISEVKGELLLFKLG